MRGLDFSSWQALLSTLLGVAVITVVMVGIRLMVMQTVQQRRERENRQINERLRMLIAAYKTLGGSFTGNLAVDPVHLRDIVRGAEPSVLDPGATNAAAAGQQASSDRSRRIRDAVEAALSDIILLGTEEQVRLAAWAASELVAGRAVHTHELVTSLRDFIREVLDLKRLPAALSVPKQGPTRAAAAKKENGGKDAPKQGGDGGASGGGVGAGPVPGGHDNDDEANHPH